MKYGFLSALFSVVLLLHFSYAETEEAAAKHIFNYVSGEATDMIAVDTGYFLSVPWPLEKVKKLLPPAYLRYAVEKGYFSPEPKLVEVLKKVVPPDMAEYAEIIKNNSGGLTWRRICKYILLINCSDSRKHIMVHTDLQQEDAVAILEIVSEEAGISFEAKNLAGYEVYLLPAEDESELAAEVTPIFWTGG